MNHDVELKRIAAGLSTRAHRHLPLTGRKPAAVALPLIPGPQGLEVILTLRGEDVEHHKGEISFPGGRVEESDDDNLSAALREAEEEIGLSPDDVSVLGQLDDYFSISGYRVSPFVIFIANPDYPFRPDGREVAALLRIPLAHLLDRAHYELDTASYSGHPVHRFRWNGHMVWGLTAAILHQFLTEFFAFGSEPEPAEEPGLYADFLARDRRCAEMLRAFHGWLKTPEGGALEPLHAGAMAHAADRYLRDFLADIGEEEPEGSNLAWVRRYLGNWYIIHTLEPSAAEIDVIAEALTRLHDFAAKTRRIPASDAREVEEALADPSFFVARLDAFFALTPERISAWREVDDYRNRSGGGE